MAQLETYYYGQGKCFWPVVWLTGSLAHSAGCVACRWR
jgi:hypothetical protein